MGDLTLKMCSRFFVSMSKITILSLEKDNASACMFSKFSSMCTHQALKYKRLKILTFVNFGATNPKFWGVSLLTPKVIKKVLKVIYTLETELWAFKNGKSSFFEKQAKPI